MQLVAVEESNGIIITYGDAPWTSLSRTTGFLASVSVNATLIQVVSNFTEMGDCTAIML